MTYPAQLLTELILDATPGAADKHIPVARAHHRRYCLCEHYVSCHRQSIGGACMRCVCPGFNFVGLR